MKDVIDNIEKNLNSRDSLDKKNVNYYINFLSEGGYTREQLESMLERLSSISDRGINETINFLSLTGGIGKDLEEIKLSLNNASCSIKNSIKDRSEQECKEGLKQIEGYIDNNF